MRLKPPTLGRGHKHLVVAVIEDEPSVVAAVRRLQRVGIGNEHISLLALDRAQIHQAVAEIGPRRGEVVHAERGCGVVADEACPPGRDELAGVAVGGCVGLLIGLSLFAIPGLGATLLAAGPVGMVMNVLVHGVWGGVGLGMLVGAIFDDRVSGEHRDYFKERLEAGSWLLIVHGDDPAIAHAADEVKGEHVERVETF